MLTAVLFTIVSPGHLQQGFEILSNSVQEVIFCFFCGHWPFY